MIVFDAVARLLDGHYAEGREQIRNVLARPESRRQSRSRPTNTAGACSSGPRRWPPKG
jgi:hypothetical protein